ncbi:DUF1236 domain-containing protein [Mesorhizobium sp. CC13]|uniref:DUF1236 domain-containing protein n=1 Tax=Mesorhizobium sp. CC13 TaxID=3029194 RepID=UPI003262DDFF
MFLRISSLTLLLLATTSGLSAQTLVLEPAQQTIVREYVIAHPVQPVVPPAGFQVVVGEVLPDVVEITPLDAPDLGASYSYVVIGQQTVLVEPGTRKIVQIIE